MKPLLSIITLFCLSTYPNTDAFDVKKMQSGNYFYNEARIIENQNKDKSSLTISISDSLSDSFIDTYNQSLIELDQYLDKDIDLSIETDLGYSKHFMVKLENHSDKDLSIVNDLGLPIIQEAKNKEGEWQPIEYILLIGSICYHTINFPTLSIIEIAAPRYKGDFQTEMRIKIGIQGYGVLTSESYKLNVQV